MKPRPTCKSACANWANIRWWAKCAASACSARWNWSRTRKTTSSFDKDKAVGIICRDFCFDNNLVMRAVGDAMIISPPLVISQADIDVFIERAWQCLDLTQKAIA